MGIRTLARDRGRNWRGRPHDRHWGPFTYTSGEKGSYRRLGAVLESGKDSGPRLRMHGFWGRTLIVEVPRWLLRPHLETREYDHPLGPSTGGPNDPLPSGAQRFERRSYAEPFSREYGFCLSRDGDGPLTPLFLQVFLGQQTWDSTTTQDWCSFLPWTTWRCVRERMLGENGDVVWTREDEQPPLLRRTQAYEAWQKQNWTRFEEKREAERAHPGKHYLLRDFDGEEVNAHFRIDERDYRRGEGWFRWLGYLWPQQTIRRLDGTFDRETGRRKGSWKGGTLSSSGPCEGTDVDAAARAYCARENMEVLGVVATSPEVGASP